MGAIVNVQIPIRKGYHGESWLLETDYCMDFLPDVGDLIHPLKNDEESGLTFEIAKRYWMEDGTTQLAIAQYIIDPHENQTLPRTWHGWWTDRDGDLVERLLANGWTKYGEDR